MNNMITEAAMLLWQLLQTRGYFKFKASDGVRANMKKIQAIPKTGGQGIGGTRRQIRVSAQASELVGSPVVSTVLKGMGYSLLTPKIIITFGQDRQVTHRDAYPGTMVYQPELSAGLMISVLQSTQPEGRLPVFSGSMDAQSVRNIDVRRVFLETGDVVVFNALLPHYGDAYTTPHERIHWFAQHFEARGRSRYVYSDRPDHQMVESVQELTFAEPVRLPTSPLAFGGGSGSGDGGISRLTAGRTLRGGGGDGRARSGARSGASAIARARAGTGSVSASGAGDSPIIRKRRGARKSG